MVLAESGIGEITAEALDKIADKWCTIACTHAPIDRNVVAGALEKIYATAKRPPPKHIVILQSPYTGAIAAAILAGTSRGSTIAGSDYEAVVSSFNETLAVNVWRMIGRRASKDWWRRIESQLFARISNSHGSARSDIYTAFSFASAQSNDPVGMQAHFLEKTGGILSHVTSVLEANVPERYLDRMIELTSQGLTNSLRSRTNLMAMRCGFGCHDPCIPFYEFFSQSGFSLPEIDGVLTMSETCGWWWPLGDVCVVTERPRFIHTDDRGRAHSNRGRAFEYMDTWGGYVWHGNCLPKRFIDFSGNMNVPDILKEPNLELRRMMLEMFGTESFVLASGAHPIQGDEYGTLYRIELSGDEPLVMVAVVNATPEPDGHFKRYFLRVPPFMQTAQQAVAWTFDMQPSGYFPKKQT